MGAGVLGGLLVDTSGPAPAGVYIITGAVTAQLSVAALFFIVGGMLCCFERTRPWFTHAFVPREKVAVTTRTQNKYGSVQTWTHERTCPAYHSGRDDACQRHQGFGGCVFMHRRRLVAPQFTKLLREHAEELDIAQPNLTRPRK